MSKGKTFVFVDTENVGHSIPLKIPKTIKAFFYIKDKNILPKVYPNCMHKRIKLIDLASRATKTKNEMDLALVTQLSIAIAKHGKKRKYVILSNDKGYDYPIYLLRRSYGVELSRMCCSLEEFISPLDSDAGPDPKPEDKPEEKKAETEPKVKKEPQKKIVQVQPVNYIPALFERYDNFESYRKAQKISQKRRMRKNRQIYEGSSSVWIEFDPYAGQWVPFKSGDVMKEIEADADPETVTARQRNWIEQQKSALSLSGKENEDYMPVLFRSCENFEQYRQKQKKAQKKRMRKNRQMYQGGGNIWVEFDPYANQWVPFLCGKIMEDIEPDCDQKAVCQAQTDWLACQDMDKRSPVQEDWARYCAEDLPF